MNLDSVILLRDATDLELAKTMPSLAALIGGSKIEPQCYPCLLVRDCPHCKRVSFIYRQDLKERANQLNGLLRQMFGSLETC